MGARNKGGLPVSIVREYESGVAAKELGRRHGVSENAVRFWKAKYQGMDVSDVVRLDQLEDPRLSI